MVLDCIVEDMFFSDNKMRIRFHFSPLSSPLSSSCLVSYIKFFLFLLRCLMTPLSFIHRHPHHVFPALISNCHMALCVYDKASY